EGPTDDADILALRARQMRNFLTTIFISQGVPMMLHGDEIERTQEGNNNTYCQDNEITWQNWDLTPPQREMLDWTRKIIDVRKQHPVLRRRDYFRGRPIRGAAMKDLSWLRAAGGEMSEEEWYDDGIHSIGLWMAGNASDLTEDEGEPVLDDTILILMNATDSPCDFKLPSAGGIGRWTSVLDTAEPLEDVGARRFRGGGTYPLKGRSMAILRHPTGGRAIQPRPS
ncbi:MAG: glycogen debranching enzyme GlgX, partial [Tepidiformaceae bacterium]